MLSLLLWNTETWIMFFVCVDRVDRRDFSSKAVVYLHPIQALCKRCSAYWVDIIAVWYQQKNMHIFKWLTLQPWGFQPWLLCLSDVVSVYPSGVKAEGVDKGGFCTQGEGEGMYYMHIPVRECPACGLLNSLCPSREGTPAWEECSPEIWVSGLGLAAWASAADLFLRSCRGSCSISDIHVFLCVKCVCESWKPLLHLQSGQIILFNNSQALQCEDVLYWTILLVFWESCTGSWAFLVILIP